MDAQDHERAPTVRGSRKSSTRVRFVVPTSTRRAPARRMILGMRTPPPISTRSPRADGHALRAPPGRPPARRRGVVVGDQRVLRAGQGDEVVLGGAERGAAAAGGPSLEQRGQDTAASRAGSPRPARGLAQGCVKDDAGRVDDRDGGRTFRAGQRVEAGEDLHRQRLERGGRPPVSARQPCPLDGDHVPRHVRERTRLARRPPGEARPDRGEQPFDRGRTGCAGRTGRAGRALLRSHRRPASRPRVCWRERVGVEPTRPRGAEPHRC